MEHVWEPDSHRRRFHQPGQKLPLKRYSIDGGHDEGFMGLSVFVCMCRHMRPLFQLSYEAIQFIHIPYWLFTINTTIYTIYSILRIYSIL